MISRYLVFIFTSILLSDGGYVLVISFDGFRYDYPEFTSTPHFDIIEAKGTKAKSLIPVFPSLTFPNHYSIATGSYSQNHNIIANHFYDKSLKTRYSMYDSESVSNGDYYLSEPIWVTAEKQGCKSATFFWIGSEAEINGYRPDIYKKYDPEVTYIARVDSVFKWFSMDYENRPNLAMLYFNEPDRSAHIHGSEHENTLNMVTQMDSILGYIEENISKLKIRDSLDVIIVSDHGMIDVSEDRLVILDDYISRLGDLYINGGGTHVQFDLKKGEEKYKNTLLTELKEIPNCRIWKKDEIPVRFHFNNGNTGEYLLLADEGWFITTKTEMEEHDFTLGGMHGYDPQLPNMHGIFYAMGPDLKSGLQIPAFENIHIYPLICELLDIIPYSGMNDTPEGDIRVLQDILKKPRD